MQTWTEIICLKLHNTDEKMEDWKIRNSKDASSPQILADMRRLFKNLYESKRN